MEENTEVIEQETIETPEQSEQVEVAEKPELRGWESDPRYKEWGWKDDIKLVINWFGEHL